MKRALKLLLNRLNFILMMILIQIVVFVMMIYYLSSFWRWNWLFILISMFIVVFLISKEDNPTYKLSWIIPIMLFPVVGGVFYLFYRYRNIKRKDVKRFREIERTRQYYLKDHVSLLNSRESHYLKRNGWASFHQTQSTYIDSGESMLSQLLTDIAAAKHHIFLEFFIIKPSSMWEQILNALKAKAAEGVEVIIIYDDFGSNQMPYHTPRDLKKHGIDVHKFNPLKLRINFANNFRNHRKIVVIDNQIAYATGNNIGDEYINLEQPFGHWLDTGVRLNGDAVWSLTVTFLDILCFITGEAIDYKRYDLDFESQPADGFVIPFTDNPINDEEITKNVYMSLIYNAKHSIKITSPYLIIDPEFKHALKTAAKSGVKISIIIPKIPDKKLVYMVTKSHLPTLMNDGIHVHTYTPGFMHAKMMIVDDEKAIIGTANLDYRSLYLHFENSVYLHKTTSVQTMSEHFDYLEACSLPLSAKDKPNVFVGVIQSLLRLFATMM